MPEVTRGLCPVCGTHHRSDFPHSLHSVVYQARFLDKHGRAPTWADALAHCPEAMRAEWREGLEALGRPWSEPEAGRPIVEHPDSFVGQKVGTGARRIMRIQDEQRGPLHYVGPPPERERPDAPPEGHARPSR